MFDIFKTPCKSCALLMAQLEYEREQNRELIETLTSLVRPKVIVQDSTVELKATSKPMTWTKKRALLEEQDRIAAKTRATSPVIAKSDEELNASVDKIMDNLDTHSEQFNAQTKQLEMELGIISTEDLQIQ